MNKNSHSLQLKVIVLLTAGLLTAACSEQNPPPPAPEPAAEARQAIEQAREQYKASKTAGHAWTNTGKLLAAATEALETGNFPQAIALAHQAEVLAKASLAQAKAEQEAWQDRLPKPPAQNPAGSSP